MIISEMKWLRVNVKKSKVNFFVFFIFGLVLLATGLLFIAESMSIYFITKDVRIFIPCYVVCLLSIGIMFIGGVVMFRTLKK